MADAHDRDIKDPRAWSLALDWAMFSNFTQRIPDTCLSESETTPDRIFTPVVRDHS